MIDAKANTTPVQLLVPATRTSTANGTGVDIRDYTGRIEVTLDVGAVSGTTPTLDIKIQESDTSGGTYTDIAGAAFTQVTASNVIASIGVDIDAVKRYIRAVATIAGTSPSFACGVNARGIPQIG